LRIGVTGQIMLEKHTNLNIVSTAGQVRSCDSWLSGALRESLEERPEQRPGQFPGQRPAGAGEARTLACGKDAEPPTCSRALLRNVTVTMSE
jgi:hypothetical protein